MTKQAALQLLRDEERLAQELPEVLALRDCPQKGPFHTEGDVLTHTKIVVGCLPDEANEELVWAGILHDIAKPHTISERERGGETINQFFKHEVVGADLAREIAGRQGIAGEAAEKIYWLVRNHMRIAALPDMRPRKAEEFAKHPYFPDLLELFKADVRGSRSRTEELRQGKERLIREVENIYRLVSGASA